MLAEESPKGLCSKKASFQLSHTQLESAQWLHPGVNVVLQHVSEGKGSPVAPMGDDNHQAAGPILHFDLVWMSHPVVQLRQGQSRHFDPVWMSHPVVQHRQGHSCETSDQAQGSTTQIQETTSVDGGHGSVGECNWGWKSVSHKDRASAKTPDATVQSLQWSSGHQLHSWDHNDRTSELQGGN